MKRPFESFSRRMIYSLVKRGSPGRPSTVGFLRSTTDSSKKSKGLNSDRIRRANSTLNEVSYQQFSRDILSSSTISS